MRHLPPGITIAFLVTLFLVAPAQAGGPSLKKVEADVTAYWTKQWPDQPIAHVAKKSDCEKGEIDDPVHKDRAGNPKKIPTCLIKTDVFVAKGYRLFIYRDTFVHYVGGRLKTVQLGELEKAWKAGGVPAPTAEQLTSLLVASAVAKLGVTDPQLTILEMGRPRSHGDFFRISALVNLTFKKDGAEQTREKVLATLQSDGGDWTVAPDLTF